MNTAICLPDHSNVTPKFDGSRVNAAYDIDRDKMNQVDMTMSKQWAKRPEDERFATLDEMLAKSEYFERNSKENPVDVTKIHVSPAMEIILPHKSGFGETQLIPTNLAFGQLCSLAAPAIPQNFAMQLPVGRAANMLSWGLARSGAKNVSAYTLEDTGASLLRSCLYNETTRVTIAQILRALRPIVGNLTGLDGSNWKTPGKVDWNKYQHNPWDMEGQESLFMSDRDACLFFCQDANPIECGVTRRGLPDVYFPGVIIMASETVCMSIRITRMMLRAVCCNLSLRGVQDQKTSMIKHRGSSLLRLARALDDVADANVDALTFKRQILEMKATKIPLLGANDSAEDKDEARQRFLVNRLGLGKKVSLTIMETSLHHEGHPIDTIADAHNAITQHAQTYRNYDSRAELEFTARKLLPKVA
jgi:hypothetical protein